MSRLMYDTNYYFPSINFDFSDDPKQESAENLLKIANDLESQSWKLQSNGGIDLITVGDCTLSNNVRKLINVAFVKKYTHDS